MQRILALDLGIGSYGSFHETRVSAIRLLHGAICRSSGIAISGCADDKNGCVSDTNL